METQFELLLSCQSLISIFMFLFSSSHHCLWNHFWKSIASKKTQQKLNLLPCSRDVANSLDVAGKHCRHSSIIKTGSSKCSTAPIVLHEFIFRRNTKIDASDSRGKWKLMKPKLICGRRMSKVQFLGIASNVFVCSIPSRLSSDMHMVPSSPILIRDEFFSVW